MANWRWAATTLRGYQEPAQSFSMQSQRRLKSMLFETPLPSVISPGIYGPNKVLSIDLHVSLGFCMVYMYTPSLTMLLGISGHYGQRR